jgi:hypothetical protein
MTVYAKIRVEITNDGKYKRSIVRGGKSKCSKDPADAKFLEEILDADIDGFDDVFAPAETKGLTEEAKAQMGINKPNPQEEDYTKIQTPQRRMETGYGV